MEARTVWLIAALLLTPLLALPQSQAVGPSFAWGSDLSQWWSLDDGQRREALAAAKASGMTVFGTDASDAGLIGWATPDYPGFTSLSPGDGAVERVARDAHAQGLKVLARFDVFQDINAAQRFPSAVIGGNPPWVDPACPEVRAYELAKLKDLLTRVDVDEIALDHVRYPGTDEVAAGARLPCTGGTLGDTYRADRSQIIASWVQEAAAAARSIQPGIVVSASVFGHTMSAAMPAIGQDAAKLAPHLDILRPMLYPSYFSSAAANAPYATVKDATAKGVQKFGAAKIQPWIQGFGAYSTSTWAICEQFRGLRDGGASGGLVWWFASTGMSSSFWTSVADCVPSSAPAPAPAPAPGSSAFDADFVPRVGNAWWVETAVTANAAIAGVTVSVNGGAPVSLPKTSWGTYAKSFYVPAGATVRFTATGADGRSDVSGFFAWPSAKPVAEPFSATFAKGGANSWWVETKVAGNAPVAGVSASVNGGAPVSLPKTSWGTYAKSFYVPAGAKIVFTATATDGQKASSVAFPWP